MSTRIKDLCKEKGVTISAIAEQIGTTQTSLSRALGENGNPTLDTLQKIATALGVSMSDLFEQPAKDVVNCPYCGGKIKIGKE
ncbi:helix-turn-helix transcriptional regulator [Parabacteroides sp. PF5-9]|uniref:helix-turn-helix domain-containing protein n=1 Tax=Parabacteroides sp. PF5-9 TaxID=1742404 RepID=UPI002475BCC0|nr:helix-turn-helix transcriptional regulator [Parabacteroides sp. PF5-9]MDH6356965.1 transcriptional regulator with XRE-family HTH domain [Parabacteroides sp. PF5-9]